MRQAVIERNTAETKIALALDLDGGARRIGSGCGFFDHMLDLFAFHSGFGLTVDCQGDHNVDDHHTVEDVGIALGQAFRQALGAGRGIVRYGSFCLPMDETLVLCAVDVGGRAYLGYDLRIPAQKIGSFDSELVQEFFAAFCRTLGATVHIRQLAGENSHHIAEAAFKAFGRALKQACALDSEHPGETPSSKGVLL